MTSTDDAQILDRGYRPFEGTRSGVFGAVRSVAWHTTRSILGLGRKGRHKVFPIIVILIAFLPPIIFLGIAILLPVDLFEDELRPEYWEFIGSSIFAVLLFAAMVAPEAVVRDRRDGMLALYLSTPLTRLTYIAAKIGAVVGTLSIIIVGPPLLFLIGLTFEGVGPDGIVNWFEVLGKITFSGIAMAAVFSMIAIAASSVADRRAFASVGIVLVLLGSVAVVEGLIEGAELSVFYRMFDAVNLPLEIGPRVFGDRTDPFNPRGIGDLSNQMIALGNFGWLAVSSALVWGRYRKVAAA